MLHKKAIDEFFTARFTVKPKSALSVAATETRYISERDGWHWCNLCKKWLDATHRASTEHTTKVHELAAIDEMIGECSPESARRWSDTPGLTGPLSRGAFRAFWGQNVDQMPQLVMDRLRSGANIEVQMSIPEWSQKKLYKKLLSMEDIAGIGFCCVSYPGSGKYHLHADLPERAITWDQLEEPVKEDTPSVDENGRKLSRLIDDDAHKVETRDKIPPGSGWWPGCVVTWKGQAQDHLCASAPDYYVSCGWGRIGVYVICWYQLFDGSYIITAWPVLLTSRL